MLWKHPPIIKVYEALGAVADERVVLDTPEALQGSTLRQVCKVEPCRARVYSSSGNKYYDVAYNPAEGAIMSNDNGSYWQGYLGYPAIAYLLATGVLDYRSDLATLLRGVKWKDINQKFKNDFAKTLAHIESGLNDQEREQLTAYVKELDQKIVELKLKLLGAKKLPPAGY